MNQSEVSIWVNVKAYHLSHVRWTKLGMSSFDCCAKYLVLLEEEFNFLVVDMETGIVCYTDFEFTVE